MNKWEKGFIILQVIAEDGGVAARAIGDYGDIWRDTPVFKTRELAEEYRQTLVKERKGDYWDDFQVIEVRYKNKIGVGTTFKALKEGYKMLVKNEKLREKYKQKKEKIDVNQIVRSGFSIEDLTNGSYMIKKDIKYCGILTLYEK